MKPRASGLMAAPVFLMLLALLFAPSVGLAAEKITFLHFQDAYNLTAVDDELGGFDRLATLVKRVRSGHENTLFLFPGDLISPSIGSSIFEGAQMIEGLNLLGVDFAAFGNHEFDFGPEVLKERLQESEFTWLATNVFENGRPFPGTLPYALVEVGDVTVGLIGLLTPDTYDLSSVGESTLISDPITTARYTAPLLESLGADVVVAATHLAVADDRLLLRAVPEIDLVLGGHEHERILQEVDGRLISKAGSDSRYLGVTTLTVGAGGVASAESEYLPVVRSIEPDPEMSRLVNKYQSKLSDRLDIVIGRTVVPLDARNSTIRAGEGILGNLAADALRAWADADLAITNGGGIRTNALFEPGPITRRDVIAWFPFGNVAVVAEVTGEQIVKALENGVSRVEGLAGRFLQVSGLRFGYDADRPSGARVLWVEVGGEPINATATYRLATNDYMLGGGDGYEVFTHARVIIDPSGGRLLDEVVADYIKAHSPIDRGLEGRIVEE